MNTTKKSASLLAAIIFAAGGGDALGQYAVWQVNQPTDYAREPTQQANLQQLQAIRSLAAQIKDLNILIENSTRLTEQHTNKMQRDIEIMRRIGQKRQELTRSLSQLEALSSTGQVFKNDPWAQAAATSGVTGSTLEKIFKEMGSYGRKPLDARKLEEGIQVGSDGAAESPLSGGDTMRSENFSVDGEYGLDVQGGEVEYSTVTKPQDVIGEVNAAKQELIGQSYNGYGFVGLGAGYVENMVGTGGRLVSLDYIPPFGNIILNPQQKAKLRGILGSRVKTGYRAATTGDRNPFEIVPGFIVRPRTEADNLYEKMVLSGDAESSAVFWASAAVYGGSQYDPARGFSAEGKFKAPVNMNDVLSNGAYQAVQDYNESKGITVNPYGQFAKVVAPILTRRLGETKPGSKLVIRAEDVRRAEGINSDGSAAVGIPSTPDEWIGVFSRSKKVHGDWIQAAFAEGLAGAIGDAASERRVTPNPQSRGDDDVFVGMGLSKTDTKEYTARVMANGSRLSENNKSLLVSVLTAKYNQECLEKVVALEEELKQLSDGADVESIIETLPMMRQNAQNTILVLQNRLAQLQAQVEEQLQAKHATLVERQSIVQEYRDRITNNGRGVVERVLSLASPTGM